MDKFFSEPFIDKASENLLLSKQFTWALCLLVPFLATSVAILWAPRIGFALNFVVVTAAIIVQIIWTSISHRWLLKNFLNVPEVKLRKYDIASAVLIACCLISSFYILDTFVGFTSNEAGAPPYQDIKLIFQAAGVIYLLGYLAFSIGAANALIRSEHSLNIYTSDPVSHYYMIPLFGLRILPERHRALVRRAQIIAEAQRS